jgi:hypothetical protein
MIPGRRVNAMMEEIEMEAMEGAMGLVKEYLGYRDRMMLAYACRGLVMMVHPLHSLERGAGVDMGTVLEAERRGHVGLCLAREWNESFYLTPGLLEKAVGMAFRMRVGDGVAFLNELERVMRWTIEWGVKMRSDVERVLLPICRGVTRRRELVPCVSLDDEAVAAGVKGLRYCFFFSFLAGKCCELVEGGDGDVLRGVVDMLCAASEKMLTVKQMRIATTPDLWPEPKDGWIEALGQSYEDSCDEWSENGLGDGVGGLVDARLLRLYLSLSLNYRTAELFYPVHLRKENGSVVNNYGNARWTKVSDWDLGDREMVMEAMTELNRMRAEGLVDDLIDYWDSDEMTEDGTVRDTEYRDESMRWISRMERPIAISICHKTPPEAYDALVRGDGIKCAVRLASIRAAQSKWPPSRGRICRKSI